MYECWAKIFLGQWSLYAYYDDYVRFFYGFVFFLAQFVQATICECYMTYIGPPVTGLDTS